jgi:hypothetical protein
MARYGHIEWRTEVAYGHQMAIDFAKIAPLATGLLARVPDKARAEPVNCQPNR